MDLSRVIERGRFASGFENIPKGVSDIEETTYINYRLNKRIVLGYMTAAAIEIIAFPVLSEEQRLLMAPNALLTVSLLVASYFRCSDSLQDFFGSIGSGRSRTLN